MSLNTKIKIPKNEKRNIEQIQEHYEIEKELAEKLRNSTLEDRQSLYTSLYDELFQKVPLHPQLTRKSSPEAVAWLVTQRMKFLQPFLRENLTFLEVGPGDCSLSIAVAKQVKQVYAVDVSNEITKNINSPPNFQFMISDGRSIPVPENSIDIAYSHQLMEHLHPDDAFAQLQNIYQALTPRGIYICITPHRLSGPHDISKYFDEVATGFHLKEYTVTELYQLFRQVGFSQVSLYKSHQQLSFKIPLNFLTILIFQGCENILMLLPFGLRKKIASLPILFRGMTIVGRK
ncbi:Methyltransferase type 11 [Halothece sp. PCC 7418]|uniref:class I SAM-dependent methyltransferase n=1 Tax=Halothece sp. (strain PCC 7418) TaxID=65093 RepID=UPI0002A0705C|nr:class I SAM-dependent methyltransferase [Halothece sp. PCC 7418]AFZ44038.1 Methyltransferase type 11 [Halothece sp. PCC 7418]